LGSSCEDFLSVNEENPNNASKVAAKLVLPAAINDVARTMNNPRRFEFVYLWHGLWSISAGYSQPMALTQYRLLNSSYQLGFSELYIAGNNFDMIEVNNTDAKDVNFVAISKIMKVYIFQNLVDCWGDVPYSQAFKTKEGILKPQYDDQQDIYEDLVLKLDEAIEMIQNASATATVPTSSADIVFAGNMNKWMRFANTLKLRILLHQAEMPGRTTYINDAMATTASVGFLGAGESALVNPGYSNSEGKMNIFYETFFKADGSSQSDGISYYMAGKDVVDQMKATNDARLGKFFQPYSGSNYDGNILGTTPLTAAALTSKMGFIKDDPGTMIGTPTKSLPLLTDFEALFLQAEAAQRSIIPGTPKSFYDEAIKRSFAYMNVASSKADEFLAQVSPKVDYDLAGNKIELIVTQKWVALNGIAPVEIWNDYRRTGYPANLHFSQDPQREKDFPPLRLLYPQREITTNNSNVPADIDAFTSKIFWQN
jgi:hypothetical protein